MSHSVCLIWGRGSFFWGRRRDFYRKQKKQGFDWKEKSMQLVWRLTCPTIYGIKHFHLSDVPLIWQTKFSPMTHKLKVLVSFGRHSSCHYGPLNKVMCFRSISPGFFRKDFITEYLLDVHKNLFKKVKQKRKRPFLYY